MRTVHETEALRPSDPVPKSMHNEKGKSGKLKIILKTPQSHSAAQDAESDADNATENERDDFTPLTDDLFSAEEQADPLETLHKKCRLRLKLTEQEGAQLH